MFEFGFEFEFDRLDFELDLIRVGFMPHEVGSTRDLIISSALQSAGL